MSESSNHRGLSLAPMRALRFTAQADQLGSLLCPPYDVIDEAARAALLDANPANAVRVVLPRLDGGASESLGAGEAIDGSDAASTVDPYNAAAAQLARWLTDGVVSVDEEPAIYIYEMRAPGHDGDPESVTRGLVGAVELRDPEDGVILPHENTMAGPVADRLALMDATDANLEPIYLVYDGGGAASTVVASVGDPERSPGSVGDHTSRYGAVDGVASGPIAHLPAESAADKAVAPKPIASAITPDGISHRLWAVTDLATLGEIEKDLLTRRALIADGHHRYATYRQLAAQRTAQHGAGPWNRGLALLVDSSAYGPQVHPIHRVVPGLSFDDAIARAAASFAVESLTSLDDAVSRLALDNAVSRLARAAAPGTGSTGSAEKPSNDFIVVLTDGTSVAILTQPDRAAVQAAQRPGEPAALMDLDVTVLHRVLIEQVWRLTDDEHHVDYAHDIEEALAKAKSGNGVAVLLRATPVDAVSAVAAAGARMPRKSTFFTPKPASGLVMRRFVDQDGIPDY